MISLDISKDKVVAARKAAEHLEGLMTKEKTESVILLLSGGSALSILDNLNGLGSIKSLTISVLDERYGSDIANNNFHQLEERLAEKVSALASKALFLNPGFTSIENLEVLASKFNQKLKDWRSQNPKGKIIITQGLGGDMHTAGIFPDEQSVFEERFGDNANWFTSYNLPDSSKNSHRKRGTVTPSFLRDQVDHSILFAVGENKSQALKAVLENDKEIHKSPGRIIHQMRDVVIFSDKSAGGGIKDRKLVQGQS